LFETVLTVLAEYFSKCGAQGRHRTGGLGRLGPHVVTGPIAVKGARPGDLLKITVAGRVLLRARTG
jgi:acetamidase/formamidase